MAISEVMYCPRCRRQLKKSAAASVLSMVAGGDARGVFLGSGAATTPCPGCGAALDVQTMLAGGYDRRVETPEERRSRRILTACVVGAVALAVGIHFALDTGFWGSVGWAAAALVGGSVVWGIGSAVVRRLRHGPRARACHLCGTPKTTRRCPHCGG